MCGKFASILTLLILLISSCKSTDMGSKVQADLIFRPEEEKAKLKTALDILFKDDERLAMTIVRYPPNSEADVTGPVAKYMETAQALADVSLFFPYDSERKQAFREVWQSYPEADRTRLLLRSLNYGAAQGEKIHLSSSFLSDPFEYDVYFDESEFLEAARFLNQPISSVSWNGNTERFDYADPKVKLAVLTLASKLALDPIPAISDLEQTGLLNKLKINRHTSEAATRSELFDLVQGMITSTIYHRQFAGQINRIALTKAVHKRLYKLLQMTPELDDRAGEYQDIFITSKRESEEKRQIFAACGRLNIKDKDGYELGYSDQKFISLADLSLFEAHTKQPLKLICDEDSYILEIEKLKAEQLPVPPPYEILSYAEQGEVNVLLTYAFSNEMDTKLLAGIVSYLATKGYFMNPSTDVRRNVSTLDEFKKSFQKADIYIPAAHLLDLNTFELGTESSTIITFTKSFRHKSGANLKAKVTAFFPEKGKGGAKSLNRFDLAQLLSERRRMNPLSLFVLTTSCNASDAISTWTSSYRLSIEADIAAGRVKSLTDSKDLIHAIAPEGSFPTSTPSEMLLDFIGPLESVKIIFEGGTPKDVYQFLKQDIKPDRFVKFIQKLENLVARKKGKIEPIRFVPRYNLEEKGLLDQRGFDFHLKKTES